MDCTVFHTFELERIMLAPGTDADTREAILAVLQAREEGKAQDPGMPTEEETADASEDHEKER